MIVSVDTLIVVLLVGVGIPLVTDLISKRGAPGWLKSLITLLLSTATGILTPLEEQAHVAWKQIVFSIVFAFVVASAAHYNAWSPFGITGDGGIIQSTVPAGISTSSTPPAAPAGDAGFAGLLVLALLLIILFGGLGFAAHILWLGLILGVVLLIASAVAGRG